MKRGKILPSWNVQMRVKISYNNVINDYINFAISLSWDHFVWMLTNKLAAHQICAKMRKYLHRQPRVKKLCKTIQFVQCYNVVQWRKLCTLIIFIQLALVCFKFIIRKFRISFFLQKSRIRLKVENSYTVGDATRNKKVKECELMKSSSDGYFQEKILCA